MLQIIFAPVFSFFNVLFIFSVSIILIAVLLQTEKIFERLPSSIGRKLDLVVRKIGVTAVLIFLFNEIGFSLAMVVACIVLFWLLYSFRRSFALLLGMFR